MGRQRDQDLNRDPRQPLPDVEQVEIPGALPPLVYCNSKWAHKPHTWHDATGALQHCPGKTA